jgi:hypothetical protein
MLCCFCFSDGYVLVIVHRAPLGVGEIHLVLLQEGDELVEVLLGGEVVAAVGSDGLEDTVLGDCRQQRVPTVELG